MSANPQPRLDELSYLALDRSADWKSEFHDGEMFPIEAASRRHSTLLYNLIGVIRPGLMAKGCEGQPGPLRLRVSATQYLYPDFQIICGQAHLTDENADTLVNPIVIVEILSPTTAGYDRGCKFELYRQLTSLSDYVLIEQSKRLVEVFSRQSEHSWSLTIFDGAEQLVALNSVGVEFTLTELYRGVEVA